MLDRRVLRIEERHVRHMSFLPWRWYNVKYGLGVFKKDIVIDDNLHEER
jgi:hypothetical protein